MEFGKNWVEVTLLNVGDVLPIGKAVDVQNHAKYSEKWNLHEETRLDYHKHLAPEYFHGESCSAVSDIYSFERLISRALE